MNSINERIQFIVDEYFDGNISKLEKASNIKPSTVKHIVGGRMSSPSYDTLGKIARTVVQIDPMWIITGEGEINKIKDCSLDDFIGETIPLYNAEASAGIGTIKLDSEYIVGCLNVPFAKKGDIAITAIGNSMTPVINSGDTLVVRQRYNWHDYLDLGEMHVVVTTEDVFVKVISDNTTDRVTLHSYNESFKDFSISKELITGIFKLIGVIGQKSGGGQIINL